MIPALNSAYGESVTPPSASTERYDILARRLIVCPKDRTPPNFSQTIIERPAVLNRR
jgi:hypothetical protein